VLSTEPIQILRVIRPMRGHSRSFFVLAADGHYYVCKFQRNPQGNRSLINECIAGHLLSALGVSTPRQALLQLHPTRKGGELLSDALHHQVASDLHWGSQCPVNPDATAIFDFLPCKLHSRITNAADLGVVFAFDRWVSTIDSRQFVFVRESNGLDSAQSKSAHQYTAWAIDHGSCFGGTDWALASFHQPSTGHRPPNLYPLCKLEDAIRGANLIESLSPFEIEAACQGIPRDWFAHGEEEALQVLLQALQTRQRNLAASLRSMAAAICPNALAG